MNKSKLKVYIACPYTIGNVDQNVKRSIECTSHLIDNGHLPFNPLLAHFVHMQYPKDYKTWTDLDMEWMKICDVLLKLPGESKGADKEMELARKLNIPIVHSIDELEKKYQ